MRSYHFKGYSVYEESSSLRFEFVDGDVLGHVVSDDLESLLFELDSGVDPVDEGWGDGIGNTVSSDFKF